jgi:serine/threonine protein kinase
VLLYIGACSTLPKVALVTEWCEKGSLEDIILDPAAHLNTQQIVRYALEIALGMNYLHSQHPRTVHRDLKSANVFVDKHFNMKVGDFGLSEVGVEPLTAAAGSPAFMAPELWRGEEYDEKVDVWSYGMLLMELVTRCTPFTGETPEQIKELVLAEKLPALPTWLPPQLQDLINNCLCYSAAARWSFATIVHKLQQWFGDWNSQRFYEEIDHHRLYCQLGSHDPRLQVM